MLSYIFFFFFYFAEHYQVTLCHKFFTELLGFFVSGSFGLFFKNSMAFYTYFDISAAEFTLSRRTVKSTSCVIHRLLMVPLEVKPEIEILISYQSIALGGVRRIRI